MRRSGCCLDGGARRLFLTSKVRLHCDDFHGETLEPREVLFLTSKVRLHCDMLGLRWVRVTVVLFLTSKVRLHCD